MDTSRVFWSLIESLGVFDARASAKHVSSDNQKRAFFSWSQDLQMNANTMADGGAGKWSKQAVALKEKLELEQHGVKKMLKRDDLERGERRDEEYVRTFFRDLSMKNAKITHVNKNLRHFHSLKELQLSNNRLQTIHSLPKNLVVLNAYANQITIVEPAEGPQAPLLHIGLGYNLLADLKCLLPFSSTVISLDLSYNSFCSLSDTCQILRRFPRLKILWLIGNPISLARYYRLAIITRLPDLEMLDGVPCDDKIVEDTNDTPPPTLEPPPASKEKPSKGVKARKGSTVDEGPDPAEVARLASEQKRKEHEETLALARTPAGLETEVKLTVYLDQVTGVVDPSLVLEPAEGEEVAMVTKGKAPAKKDGKKGSKKGAAGSGASRGEWEELEPGVFGKTLEEESTNEEGQAVKTTKSETREFKFVLKYRLEGEVIYETKAVPFSDDGLLIEHAHELRFEPDASWRDFLQLFGLDFLLYLRSSSTSKVTVDTSVPKEGEPVVPAPKKGGKGGAAADNMDVVTETEDSSSSADSLLGAMRVDLSPLVKAAMTGYTSKCTLEAQPDVSPAAELDAEWDPLEQRRLTHAYPPGRPTTSSLGKRAQIGAAAAAAASTTDEPGLLPLPTTIKYRISLNLPDVPAVVADEPDQESLEISKPAAPVGKRASNIGKKK